MALAGEKSVQEQVVAILSNLSREQQELLRDVIQAERAKLHMSKPRLNDEIWKAIVETIK